MAKVLAYLGVLACSVLLAMPYAAALTTVPTADGDTDVSNTDCLIDLAVPADQTITLSSNPDTVRVPMGAQWYDHRTSGSAAILHRFQIYATYGVSGVTNYHEVETTGGMSSPSMPYAFWADVPGVTRGTTMDVVYSVSVRYKLSGVVLCSADNSSEPELTTFTFV